jgi:hypothetical protein
MTLNPMKPEEIKTAVCALLGITPERYEMHRANPVYPTLLSQAKLLLYSGAIA